MTRPVLTAVFAATLAVLPALWSDHGTAAAQQSDIDTSTVQDMALGDADAPVTMIEYASFTCPHCASFHEDVFPELKRDYIDTGKVRFIHREVYFDRYGLWAGMVARCGGEMRYFGIADRIYETQRDWTAGGDPATIAGNLRRIGLAAGLSEDELEACLSDAQKAETLVAWYEENAAEDGIQSTPSFVIDGELFSNRPYADLAAEIDSRLPADG